jgi:aspartate aminotransferase-like enzyme
VTAVRAPKEVSAADLRKALRERHGIVVAGGRGASAGEVFRVGHLGLVHEPDVKAVVSAIGEELPRLGFVPVGASRG